MGLTEIRTACKVDLKKPADQQANLHVRPCLLVVVEISLNFHRIDGTQMVRQAFT